MSEPVRIIHCDASLVVVAKQPGVPSQPDRSGDLSALAVAEQAAGTALHPIHRIDRPASGLLVFGADRAAAGLLTRMLREGSMRRRYWAVVSGVVEPESGTLEDRLLRNGRTNKSYVNARGKPSRLTFTVKARGDRYTLLEVELQTGRHHQVRAQLAHRGWPIRGDLKYGARRSLPGGGIMLHAAMLDLPHPQTGTPLSFFAPPPDDPLWNALTSR